MSQGESMVANGYDGLDRGVGRGVGTQALDDSNGVGVCRHFFCNERWEVVETLCDHRNGPRWSCARGYSEIPD